MIAVDTSAVAAIILGEADSPQIEAAIAATACVISAVSYFETQMVVGSRQGDEAIGDLEALVLAHTIDIVPFDAEQADAAFLAFSTYGKGQGHPAQLNFGDCAAYALAKTRDLKLLFKGTDFAQTDLTSAL